MKQTITVAFGSVPKDGGTFTFYRTVRPKLAEHGIDFRCVTVGRAEAQLWDDSFADDGCALLCKEEDNLLEQAGCFARWCEDSGVDIVMALNSAAIHAALPHLPGNIRVMSRLASITDNGLKKTASCSGRLARVITTAPGHERELLKRFQLDRKRIHMIPNGIDPVVFDSAARNRRGMGEAAQIGFLGRLEHNDKGALFLPEIIRGLDRLGTQFHFRIAGKGVFGRALRRYLQEYVRKGRVTFAGPLPPSEVPGFLGSLDILVFPSQAEGCPNTLLEAMMAGCATVSSRLEGITDFIVEDGRSGFLCPVGDCTQFADRIAELAADRPRLRKVSEAAASVARERFSQERVASEYARVFRTVMAEPPVDWTPLPWSRFQPDPDFAEPIWHASWLRPLKKKVKNILYHLRLSNRYEE